MADTVPVLMPYPERRGSQAQLAPRIDGFERKTIGIINNGWKCMEVISDEYRKALRRLGVKEIVERKISVSQRLPESLMDGMAAKCDAAIVGIGN